MMYEVKNVIFKESISVVIPLHNKELNIENTIKSVVKYITAPKLQIIIVENQSTDSSKIIAEKIVKELQSNIDISLMKAKKVLVQHYLKGLSIANMTGFTLYLQILVLEILTFHILKEIIYIRNMMYSWVQRHIKIQ